MYPRPELVAAFFTLAGDVSPWGGSLVSPHDLRERAEAASAAGYVGMGFVSVDLEAAIDHHGVAGVRSILADNGIRYLELEAIVRWLAEGEDCVAADAHRLKLLEMAAELDVWNIKALGDFSGREWPIDFMTERFHTICADTAARTDAQVTIEIFPTTNIRDLKTATAVVEGADMANGGLLLDIWHMTRGGVAYADFAKVPSRWIKAIELNDATAELVGDLMDDSSNRRRLPGEGDFDIPSFLRHVRETGYVGPYGVEIASEEHRRLPLAEAAQRSFDATMEQFTQFRNTV
ncbi:sugar phosphate isomerase/epimerase [Novosphingobium sp. G106]|uniref:sugar phosphate isomerase/epimerase family protein n=1 Tax=Novosphingobium sp. G106 TaxID=2849500 RepID=UPI001C2D4E0C|nr:sugar phosphate isomerase/epimerase [Novosphingobium sp. G106]MBV1687179.1 sugar phosphate isomerase/epimerase [Novosphingobium sp. G106]